MSFIFKEEYVHMKSKKKRKENERSIYKQEMRQYT